MKKFSFSLIILNTILVIYIINLIIYINYEFRTKNKPLKHTYADLVISELQLNEKDLDILHNEHWQRLSSKFKYVPFVGHTEIKKKGKFVNIDNENGRLIRRPNLCSKNIYVYGGSTTFGYNVTDTQTYPHYLQELVNKNFCVYNHGRAYFYSKQENALFNNHLENQKKIDYAIFLDGVNERCGSFEYINNQCKNCLINSI